MSDTQVKIIEEGQDLLQRSGFFGLSLQDLADRIGIKKASLYSHFRSKEDLAISLIEHYQKQFELWCQGFAHDAPEYQLERYFNIFERYLKGGKVCPASALSLDSRELPVRIKKRFREFLDQQHLWIESVIANGQRKGVFNEARTANEYTQIIFNQIIGAQLVSRLQDNLDYYTRGREQIIQLLRVPN
jgi:TetR/AcrR family transcriptional repressor of nem operon